MIDPPERPMLGVGARRLAWSLGLGGLLPFIAHAGLAWWIAPPLHQLAAASQILYAAVILTFIGALHWGLILGGVVREQIALRLLWSVLPSLYAFSVAQLVQSRALPLLALGLVVALVVDAFFYRQDTSLRWFLSLRLVLTSVAVICLLLTMAAL